MAQHACRPKTAPRWPTTSPRPEGHGKFFTSALCDRLGVDAHAEAHRRRHGDLAQVHALAGRRLGLDQRVDQRSQGVTLSVLKNTLARRAVAGSAFEIVGDQMTGPLIYGFSEDAVAAAKVVADFAKTNDKLVIRGGAFGGKALDVDGVKQLANIPSKEVLLAQLLGLMQSPISRTARVLAALAEKRGGGEAPAEAAAEAQAA